MQANFGSSSALPEYYVDADFMQACHDEKPSCCPVKIPPDSHLFARKPAERLQQRYYSQRHYGYPAARWPLVICNCRGKAIAREGYEQAVAKWEELLAKLPEYKFDHTGRFKEWALDQYERKQPAPAYQPSICAWPAMKLSMTKLTPGVLPLPTAIGEMRSRAIPHPRLGS